MNYDFIIVGGGAAGLYTGIELLKRKPTPRVVLLEKYGGTGGRVSTYRDTHHGVKYQWEEGAGRISEAHTLVNGLIKKYGLHTHPIGNGQTNWYDRPNPFLDLIPTYLEPLKALPSLTLKKHTIRELLEQIHGSEEAKAFCLLFPYWAETNVTRADIALESFAKELGGTQNFHVVAEGFQAITDCMTKEFKTLGGILQLKTTVTDVQETDGGADVFLESGHLKGTHVILALPGSALKKLPSVEPKMPILKHLIMCPLLRCYAVFPVHKGESWFSDIPSTVVGNALRYIIPVSSTKGVIMISYTDGDDAFRWIEMKKEKGLSFVKQQIMALVRKTFPNKSIPNPRQFTFHPWSRGCTYWGTGLYDPQSMLTKSYHISKHIHACGESLSLHQEWVESALESSINMLKGLK